MSGILWLRCRSCLQERTKGTLPLRDLYDRSVLKFQNWKSSAKAKLARLAKFSNNIHTTGWGGYSAHFLRMTLLEVWGSGRCSFMVVAWRVRIPISFIKSGRIVLFGLYKHVNFWWSKWESSFYDTLSIYPSIETRTPALFHISTLLFIRPESTKWRPSLQLPLLCLLAMPLHSHHQPWIMDVMYKLNCSKENHSLQETGNWTHPPRVKQSNSQVISLELSHLILQKWLCLFLFHLFKLYKML